ncbi:hypothetical protein CK501_02025 [Halovibrio salipaludis]|uniref:Uncharacterized protein n=1 Tax=Halovibrio salipaludis TaxID=2032626 RepID=A0A2A2FAU1_9GAMM|nr:hypothetical protein CK501_02025 [Halovibrio salipaludis]
MMLSGGVLALISSIALYHWCINRLTSRPVSSWLVEWLMITLPTSVMAALSTTAIAHALIQEFEIGFGLLFWICFIGLMDADFRGLRVTK